MRVGKTKKAIYSTSERSAIASRCNLLILGYTMLVGMDDFEPESLEGLLVLTRLSSARILFQEVTNPRRGRPRKPGPGMLQKAFLEHQKQTKPETRGRRRRVGTEWEDVLYRRVQEVMRERGVSVVSAIRHLNESARRHHSRRLLTGDAEASETNIIRQHYYRGEKRQKGAA
jgi:hypothetical protein